MSTDPGGRISAAIRAIADQVPADPPPIEALRARSGARPTRRPGHWRIPVLAAAAVLVVLALVAVLPGWWPSAVHPRPAAPEEPAVLPARFAGMSLLTAPVSGSPPGPVIALYRQGSFGSRDLGTSQVVALGADGRTYRRLDLAEQRGNMGADGEWGSADYLLSPDGTAALVANGEQVRDRMEMVDLRTGQVTGYTIDPPRSVLPLSWSRDGRRIAVLTNDGPLDGSAGDGALAVFEVASGELRPIPGPIAGWTAAFSPDGQQLAVGGNTEVRVVDLAGAVRRTLAIPKSPDVPGSLVGSLADGNAWSPDGRLLALAGGDDGGCTLAFLDATGTGAAPPPPIRLAGYRYCEPLGWRTAGTMLVGASQRGYQVLEVPVRGGSPRTISYAGAGLGNITRISRLEIAAGLTTGFEVRDAGSPDRGPWPGWWRATSGAGALLAALLVLVVIRHRRRATRSGNPRRTIRTEAPNRQ